MAGTSFQGVVPAGTPPRSYQVRVIGLTPDNLPAGSFSDAVTVTVR